MTRRDPAWTFIATAIEEAAALLDRMEPTTEPEAEALHRSKRGITKLQDHIERERQRSERGPLAAMPLMLGLPDHPDPEQARRDHLVWPLITKTGSITTLPQAKAWLGRWIIDANEAINGRPRKDRGGEAH